MDGGGNACASFQPLTGSEGWTGTESQGMEGKGRRGRLFPFTGSSFNRKRKPAPSALLACQPACLSASQLACHRYLPLLPPPLFRSGFTEIFPSPLFSWWPGSDWREIRNRLTASTPDAGRDSGWIHFLGIRLTIEHVTRRKTSWRRISKRGDYFKSLNFNR